MAFFSKRVTLYRKFEYNKYGDMNISTKCIGCFILVAVIFIGQQAYDAIAVVSNISNLSHIIGGMIGALLGYNLNVRSKYR